MSGYEAILADVLARLSAPPVLAKSVRRAHRTAVPREGSNAVHVIAGSDAPADKCTRKSEFSIALFVRSDAAEAPDPLRVEVMRRLSPYVAPYASGVAIVPGKISVDTEIADVDVTRVDMDFTMTYPASDWTL